MNRLAAALSLALCPLSNLTSCTFPQGSAPPAPSAEDLAAMARAIHERVITLDTHKDIRPTLASQDFPEDPAALAEFRRANDPTVRGENQFDFPKAREGGYDCGFFIVYVGQGPLNPAGYRQARAQALLKFDAIDRMCRHYGEHIELARTPDDVERIASAGKLVACIGIENGYPMGEDIAAIAEFHRRGARYMSIAHNRHSQLGDSHTPDEPLHGGLSELGRQAIDELNRVGIMVDISHASKTAMMEATRRSKAPVIASHSAARALCDVTRNLDDEQLLALRENGGVIQCVALADFVKQTPERAAAVAAAREELGLPEWGRRPTEPLSDEELERRLAEFDRRVAAIEAEHPRGNVSDFVDHIDHIVRLIGIDHCGIATDFDGGGGVTAFNDVSETFAVTLELVRRGYNEQEIAKIWSGNLLRVWRDVERVAARLQAGG